MVTSSTTNQTNDCINQTLSVTYEALDFSINDASETFDVFDNNGSLITNCEGGGQCNAWQTCLDSADVLGASTIYADSSYTIRIEPYDAFNNFCPGRNYSFYAAVTLNCGGTSGMFYNYYIALNLW